MKKLLLTLTAVAALTTASQAQDFSKGNIIVEGNLGLTTTNNKNTEIKTTKFNFTPKVGYFLTDKIAVGLNLKAATLNTEDKKNDREEKFNTIGAGVFGRFYFLDLGRFKTYTELNADFSSTKNEATVGNSTNELNPKVTDFGVNGGIGANYFLTDKIAVNFAFANVIGYNTSKAKGGEPINSFGLNLNKYDNFFDAATFGLTFKF